MCSPVGRPGAADPHPWPIHNIWVDRDALMTVNLLVCALSFNTYSQTNCLTKFAKCIFWLQHFYLGKMPGLSASKDFSPFLANLPKKHQRELLIFSLVLIQLIFPPSFLSFLLLKLTSNKSYFFRVPATCQSQHHSQYELQFSPLLYKDPFLGSIDNTGICQACFPLAFIFWVATSLDESMGLNPIWILHLHLIARCTLFFFFKLHNIQVIRAILFYT